MASALRDKSKGSPMTFEGALLASTHHMAEHPGWRDVNGQRRRPFRVGSRVMVAIASDEDDSTLANILDVDRFDFDQGFADTFSLLCADVGSVRRVRNPNLWDAIATAIIRQVIRAQHAKKMYREFCRAFGERVLDENGEEYWLIPDPSEVLELTDDDFGGLGMAFKRKGLRSAADAFLRLRDVWLEIEPSDLVLQLQSVAHIGPWTARAAVADYSNDWALYPYNDLAVRTWARLAMPDFGWAEDEVAFELQWRELGGARLADVTVLTLAWGDRHGATAKPGGAGSRR